MTVDRVDVKDRPVAAGEMAEAFEEGTIRVPVRGEEAVVSKEAVVTGEVVIDRDVKTERQTISDTVRKERVDVDENYSATAPRSRSTSASAKSGLGANADTRTFADAEPHYRRGYEAAHDERYAGRDFAESSPSCDAPTPAASRGSTCGKRFARASTVVVVSARRRRTLMAMADTIAHTEHGQRPDRRRHLRRPE